MTTPGWRSLVVRKEMCFSLLKTISAFYLVIKVEAEAGLSDRKKDRKAKQEGDKARDQNTN